MCRPDSRRCARDGALRSPTMRVLLVTPPMTQLNTPYPATAYLTGFLRLHAAELGFTVTPGGRVARAVSTAVLVGARGADGRRIAPARARGVGARACAAADRALPRDTRNVTSKQWSRRSDSCKRRDPSLALRIVGRTFLPEGPRFAHLRPPPSAQHAEVDEHLAAAFGTLGSTEQARYLASLYVDDLADVWRAGIDPRFELARYAERLAASAPSFDPLREALDGEPTLVDETLDELTRELVAAQRPDVVGMTAPFPGNVYGAFRMARAIRAAAPNTDHRARRRLGQHRAARASRAARVRLLRLRDARRWRAAAAESAVAARGQGRAARAHLRAPGRRGRARERRHAARHPEPRHRDPDLRRPAAGRLRLGARDVESDAPTLVRRALEQNHARARLLLEEVHVLRRVARLHRPLRPAERRRRRAENSRADRGDRRDGLPPRRRGRAAGRAARAREAAHRRQARASPGGATFASRRRSRPSSARCSPSPVASQ